MIPRHLEEKILFFHLHEKWPVGTIAKTLRVHHGTVKRVLAATGNADSQILNPQQSIVTPYVPYVKELIEKYPDIRASRVWQMCVDRGYKGKQDHFRAFVCRLRPRKKEAFLKLRTLPGEEAQVDWGHFGHMQVGKTSRPLSAFVMVLSWSRQIFIEFFLEQRMCAFLEGHNNAFSFFNAVPRVLLYDNLRSAVVERIGDAIKFNETFLAYASKVGFEPRPVNIRRGNEKGRVERHIRYVRDNFFAAREFKSLEDLNAQAREWMTGKSAERKCPGDSDFTVAQAFEQEKNYLRKLESPLPWVEERVEARISKTPYARFERNDYSVPPEFVCSPVTLLITRRQVRIASSDKILAEHERCYDKGKTIEDHTHLEALRQTKKMARGSSATSRLLDAVPEIEFFLKALANIGGNLGSAVISFEKLLARHGAQSLGQAVAEATAANTLHTGAVGFILDRLKVEKNELTPIPLTLPEDSRIRDVFVKPHQLKNYDSLGDTKNEDDL